MRCIGCGSTAVSERTERWGAGLFETAIGRHEAIVNTMNLMFINYFIFWVCASIVSAVSDFAVLSEQDWQKQKAWRAAVWQAFCQLARAYWHGGSSDDPSVAGAVQKPPAEVPTQVPKDERYYRRLWRAVIAPENIARTLLGWLLSISTSIVTLLIAWKYLGIDLVTIIQSRLK
jgi:hypothetical protein